MHCYELMTGNPTYCVPTDTVAKAARLMKASDVGALPVCQDRRGKKLIGIITDRDLAISIVAEARDPDHTTVQEVMTREPLVCQGFDEVEHALDCMSLCQVRRIPVIGKSGELVGIISQADVAVRTGQPQKAAEVLIHISKPSIMEAVTFRQSTCR